jgi:hypothetical protein
MNAGCRQGIKATSFRAVSKAGARRLARRTGEQLMQRPHYRLDSQSTRSVPLIGLVSLLSANHVLAQETQPAPGPLPEKTPAAESAAPAPAPPPVDDLADGAVQPEAPDPASNPADSTRADIEALKAEVAELRQKQEEAELASMLDTAEPETDQELFKVYGFLDMGFQRSWTKEDSLLSGFFETNAGSFVVGNIDLYFDFNPHPYWRGLAEIRFTNAPQGTITNFGGLGGEFERTNTEQFDPNGTALNAPMWGGYSVIERAYIEWHRHQAFNVLVGSFFTPFGIWLVDHGSPTLISVGMPQFIQQKFMPLRQTGVQALGSFFISDYELAYRAWISNGRTEENPFDYDDDKGFGGRFFVRRDTGKFNFQVGVSYQYDHVRDKVVDIVGFAPLKVQYGSTYDYDEHVIGADVSVDLGPTRIRLEGAARRQDWWDGKPGSAGTSNPGTYYPDRWQLASYLIVAHQLPWWGLEPYIYAEVMQQPWIIPDGLALLSAGLNVRFTPATMLKIQGTQGVFFDSQFVHPGDPSDHAVTTLLARLVMAF